MYDDKVMQRFLKPLFVGEIEQADAIGEVGNMKCGDIMKIFLKIDKKTDTINDIKFKTYGCVTAIASTDYLCELALNKTLDDALKITSMDVVKQMGNVPQIKVHCSIIAQRALKAAIEEYRK